MTKAFFALPQNKLQRTFKYVKKAKKDLFFYHKMVNFAKNEILQKINILCLPLDKITIYGIIGIVTTFF